MIRKNLHLIIAASVISAIISLVLCNLFITSPKNRQEEVEVVTPITSDFKNPSDTYFNNQSINPTQLITIGKDTNNQPFNSNSQ